MQNKKKLIVGLTGGFGSGKSTVTEMIRALKIPVIDADEIARDVVQPGTATSKKLRKEFGPKFFHKDGSLNRPQMAHAVFTKLSLLKKLNAITHPPIQREINRELREHKKRGEPIVIIDVALLYEAQMEKMMDQVIVVWAPQQTCITRLVKNRGFTRQEALRRIRSQMSLQAKKQRADYVIDNSETPPRTRRLVTKLVQELIY